MRYICSRLTLFSITLVVFISLPSCSRVAKSPFNHWFSTIFKQTGEDIVETAGDKATRLYGKEALKEMPWEDIIMLLEKENPLLGSSIKGLSSAYKRHLANSIQVDPKLLRAILSSETIYEDYSRYVKKSKKMLEDVDFFTWYAKSKYSSSKLNAHDVFERVIIRQEQNTILLVEQSSGNSIAAIKDGVVTVLEPMNGSGFLTPKSILKGDLRPNSIYKYRGEIGLEYLYNVDEIGRVSSVKVRSVSPDAFSVNVLARTDNVDLGSEGSSFLKRVRESSNGDDVNLTTTYKYTDDAISPSFVNIEGDVAGRNQFSQTFKNLSPSAGKSHSVGESRAIVKIVADKIGISQETQEKLVREMSENDRLSELIFQDPEYNIRRWLNTRNPVDQRKLAKTPNGRPLNYNYAGNTFYFEPCLNNKVANALASSSENKFRGYTREQLEELNRMFPNGVPYTEQGFPDFLKAGACLNGPDGKPFIVNMPNGKFTGDRENDFAIAREQARKIFGVDFNEGEYTWHHLEGNPARLVLVYTKVHEVCAHTGGHSLLN